MAMEAFDISDIAQKRATRKLLIAGVTCIILAVISLAIVVAVVIRQNEKERISYSSFDKQPQDSSHFSISARISTDDLVPSSSGMFETSLSSQMVIDTSSLVKFSSQKTFSSFSDFIQFYSSSAFEEHSSSTKENITRSHPDIQVTYSSSYNIPHFSTKLSTLSSYKNSLFSSNVDSLKTDILSHQGDISSGIFMTDTPSENIDTSFILTEEIHSTSYDISVSSSLNVPKFSVATISDDFNTIKSNFEKFWSTDISSIQQVPNSEILSTLSKSDVTKYSSLSEDRISLTREFESTSFYLPLLTNSLQTGKTLNSLDLEITHIPSTNQSYINDSKDITSTEVAMTESFKIASISNEDLSVVVPTLVPMVTSSDTDLDASMALENSSFKTSSLEPHQTSYQLTSFSDVISDRINPTTWSQTRQQHIMTTTFFPECSMTEFRCSSGQCIHSNQRCDRMANCEDMTDDINCTNCLGFQCKNGLCLWSWNVQCNKHIDCYDLSDEINCDFGSSHMRCNNRMHIPSHKWCDNVDDCYDNSDELNCTCGFMEKSCLDGHCIRKEWICDGHVDCVNATDEESCSTCTLDQYICNDYTCVNRSQVCDGVDHCPEADDETKCFYIKKHETLVIQLKGDNYSVCNTHWNSGISDKICQNLGYKKSSSTLYMNISNYESDYLELLEPFTKDRNILKFMNITSSCTTNMTVSITCMQRECGETSPDLMLPFVAGGDIASLGQWPWMVSLSYLGRPFCSGSLISDQWVVTAGHCVARPGYHNYTGNPHYVEAMLGSVKRLRGQGISRRADRIIHHPRLKWTGIGPIHYDVALIHLRDPVIFDDFILPICLPQQDYSSLRNCYIAGWGYIGPNQDITVQDLREAKLHVLDDDECHSNTVPLEGEVNTNITLCAGYKFGVISGCQGDSGSPMMCQDNTGGWTLAGVMSSGAVSCGTFNTIANRFTRMSAMLEWIEDMVGS